MNNTSPVKSEELLKNLPEQLSQTGANVVKKDKNENEVETTNKNAPSLVACPRPPKPFKKATYPWQIKNYQFTIEKMTESIKKEIEGIEMMRRNPQTCGTTSAVGGPDQKESPEMCTGGTGCPLAVATGAVRSPAELQLLQDFSRIGYKELLEHSVNQSQTDPAARFPTQGFDFSSNGNEDPNAAADRPFSILTWHTRQLCRSIFDTTVHRMLERMNYITPDSVNPAMMCAAPEKITQEQADQIAMQNNVVTEALQRKFFLESQFSYDQIESATSSDYDSSDEDTEEELEPLYEASAKGVSAVNLAMDAPSPRTTAVVPLKDSKDEMSLNLCDAQNDCDDGAKPMISRTRSTSPTGKRLSESESSSESKRFKSDSPVTRNSPNAQKTESCASSPIGIEAEFSSTNSSLDCEANANSLILSSPIKFGLKHDLAFQEA